MRWPLLMYEYHLWYRKRKRKIKKREWALSKGKDKLLLNRLSPSKSAPTVIFFFSCFVAICLHRTKNRVFLLAVGRDDCRVRTSTHARLLVDAKISVRISPESEREKCAFFSTTKKNKMKRRNSFPFRLFVVVFACLSWFCFRIFVQSRRQQRVIWCKYITPTRLSQYARDNMWRTEETKKKQIMFIHRGH